MHEHSPPPFSDSAPDLSLTGVIRLGLLVLFSEIKWMILLAFRNWEIAQLSRRLNQELHSLGLAEASMAGLDVAAAEPPTDIFNEKDLALKQISFLSEEIKHLATQLDAERQEYIQRRVKSWGLA
jgi:hypothetical protein